MHRSRLDPCACASLAAAIAIKDIEAAALPVGTFHARLGLDTAYSQGLDGSVAQ